MAEDALLTSTIRPATAADADAISAIYNYYVLNTIVTFEEEAVSAARMAARIREVQSTELPWLVAVRDHEVLGYAYATRWKGRCAYRFTAELTIYLHPEEAGRGIGTSLYGEVIRMMIDLGYHAVIGGVALPNDGSAALHEKLGFRKVAHFEQVGFKFDRWIDVGYWQRML